MTLAIPDNAISSVDASNIGRQWGDWRQLTVSFQLKLPGTNRRIRYTFCECKCGTIKRVKVSHLKDGGSTACFDCRQTHNLSGTPIYKCWQAMNQRCYNAKCKAYRDYGARGIRVCDRWRESFENFLADMGERPSKRHSLDRIKVNGNYEPGNCRWATAKVQQRNRRVSRTLTFDGKTQSLPEWSEELGISMGTLHSRISYGMPVESILSVTRCKPRRNNWTATPNGEPD